MRNLFIAAIFFILSPVATAEIYRHVDENGRVHYSDVKQDQLGQTQVELKTEKNYWKKLDISVEGIGVDISKEDVARIQEDVNNVYQFFDRKLYFDIYQTIPVKVKILKDADSYDEFIRANITHYYGRTGGMFFPRLNIIATYMRKDKERFFRVVKHETSHAIIHTTSKFVPSWLDEGLAENMEMLISDQGSLVLNHHDSGSRFVKAVDKKGQLMGLREFLSLPSTDWRKKDRATDYVMHSQAGELTRMLLSSADQRSFLIKLVHGFKQGSRTLTFWIVEKEYVGGMDVLELKWSQWVRREDTSSIRL
ncbi:hypothetical protein BTA51_06275 [Hahella sp. CCB-MM4]|uniref:DUF4124 domain-containing protein n=1 Tax=Hahella sp. (strain CCB-MM4) TaxID=1926491 RepID=UPI000B9A71C0|nr:DUF4124 domain-containing protein [Hahella sp. CCB-MM4]OZG74599.1 hypothetical protein BTA51_06275 [Hahella sp. CCB-MM4]